MTPQTIPQIPQLDRGLPINRSLAAWWACAETTGNVIYNGLQAGLNLTLTGVTARAFSAGRSYDKALLLNGTTQYATGTPTAAFVGTDISLVAWIKYGATMAIGRIIDADPGGVSGTFYGLIIVADKAYVYFDNRGAGTSDSATGGPSLNDGLWHLLVGVRSIAANNVKLYVDGVLVATSGGLAYSGTITPTAMGLGISPGSATQGFAGAIQHTRVLTRALTQGEIYRLYAQPLLGALGPKRRFLNALAAGRPFLLRPSFP